MTSYYDGLLECGEVWICRWSICRRWAEQDVYVFGTDQPMETYTGKVIAVYHRLNDNEVIYTMSDISKLSKRYSVRILEESDVEMFVEICKQNRVFYEYTEARPTKMGLKLFLKLM